MLAGGFVHYVLLLIVVSSVSAKDFQSSFTPEHIRYLQNETKSLFQFGWNSYIENGFPADEVRPITCKPYGPDFKNIDNTIRNDAMGNVSSTMLDNLDTLIIMEEWDHLKNMLKYLKDNKESYFEQDTIVQVFESSIRYLGGLLSAHLLLTDIRTSSPDFKQIQTEYDGFLLEMAHDLGSRLIPTYKTKTHIPVPRVNLAKGVKSVPIKFQQDACTSGVMTPVLEFTLLSKLTGDPQFQYYSQMTYWKIWSSKSSLNLLPMTIDPIKNSWKDSLSGIGASIDSFYEYSAKAAILFDDNFMWSVFKTSYKALLVHSAQEGGKRDGTMIFPNIGTQDGAVFSEWIDSLSAFWSGLQVLTGQLSDAIKTHAVYLKIWDHFDSIPERWAYTHFNEKPGKKYRAEDSIVLEWYPLRPEFIESTYYLYRATRDSMYLQIGERIVNLFKTKFKTKCGFCGVQDVRSGKRQNRMESFVLGETLKYLYLLFDTNDEIFLHSSSMQGKNWIFSTEGHPLWYNKRMERVNPSEEDFEYENSFYRNITLPLVADFKLPDTEEMNHFKKVDPFYSRFETCELNPFKKWTDKNHNFMASGYYAWDNLFVGDHEYRKSLIKPKYLSKTQMDGSYIELTRPFYNKFSQFTPKSKRGLHLQSPVRSNTEKIGVILGDISSINEVEVSKFSYKDPHQVSRSGSRILENDLWVPELQSLKLNIEKLRIGQIDSRGQVVTQKYIQDIRTDDYDSTAMCSKNDEKDVSSVMRITKLNGVHIEDGAVIWTLPFIVESQNGQSPAIDIASDGRVVFQGDVVENLVVWYD